MKLGSVIVGCAVLGMVVSGCGHSRTHADTHTVTGLRLLPAPTLQAGSPVQQFYGSIRALTRDGKRYFLRLDPSWFVEGVTANVLDADQTGVRCRPTRCEFSPDDYATLDEGHHTLTFVVPARVRGTVLISGPKGSPVTIEQLAQIVHGTSRLKLYEPIASGVWIVVRGDTVYSFAQQYRP